MTPAPWRVGRKLGRTLFRQEGPAPSDMDPLIGVMDTREDARRVVDAVNLPHYLTEWRVTSRLSCDCCVDLHHVTCDYQQHISGDLTAIMFEIRDHTCGGGDDA